MDTQESQQLVIVSALELGALIANDRLRNPMVATHAIADDQHAGAVTGFIKRDDPGEDHPSESVDKDCQPGFPHLHTGSLMDALQVQLGMVDMSQLEWSGSVSGRLSLDTDVRDLQGVAGLVPFACLFELLWTGDALDFSSKSLEGRRHYAFFRTDRRDHSPRGFDAWRGLRFDLLPNYVVHDLQRPRSGSALAVAA